MHNEHLPTRKHVRFCPECIKKGIIAMVNNPNRLGGGYACPECTWWFGPYSVMKLKPLAFEQAQKILNNLRERVRASKSKLDSYPVFYE